MKGDTPDFVTSNQAASDLREGVSSDGVWCARPYKPLSTCYVLLVFRLISGEQDISEFDFCCFGRRRRDCHYCRKMLNKLADKDMKWRDTPGIKGKLLHQAFAFRLCTLWHNATGINRCMYVYIFNVTLHSPFSVTPLT